MVKIFCDGADLKEIELAARFDRISGFTTNPSLMKKSGISDYESFANAVLGLVAGKPVSFEVLANDLPTMALQARRIATWGKNIYVKIPVTTTQGEFTGPILRELSGEGIKLNVTAIMAGEHIEWAARSLSPLTPAILSIFAGRIADTGRDPTQFIATALAVKHANTQILWGSPRQVYDVKIAEACQCDIITLTWALIDKLALFGMDLNLFSRMTVQQFHDDAKGLSL